MANQQYNISDLNPLFEFLRKQQQIEKNRRLFEVGITFFLISFFLFFAIKPTILTISALVADINSKKILSTKMIAKIDQIISAQDNFSLIQEKYFLVEDALPMSPNYVSTVTQFDSISAQSGLLFDKINFAQSDKQFFSTQISTNSSFNSSLNFLDSLFKNRRLYDVNEVMFIQDKNTQSQGVIRLSLPIDIYYWNTTNEKK
jgi:hypothetical protein